MNISKNKIELACKNSESNIDYIASICTDHSSYGKYAGCPCDNGLCYGDLVCSEHGICESKRLAPTPTRSPTPTHTPAFPVTSPPPPSSTPTKTPTATATATFIPTPTPSISPTTTTTRTPTPTDTARPTPTPTQTVQTYCGHPGFTGYKFYKYATIYDNDCCTNIPGNDTKTGGITIEYDCYGRGRIYCTWGSYSSTKYIIGSTYGLITGGTIINNIYMNGFSYSYACCNADGQAIYAILSDQPPEQCLGYTSASASQSLKTESDGINNDSKS